MISEEDLKKFRKHINKKWKHQSCRMCEENNWNINGYVHIALSQKDSRTPADPNLPCVLLTCLNCGNTELLYSLLKNLSK